MRESKLSVFTCPISTSVFARTFTDRRTTSRSSPGVLFRGPVLCVARVTPVKSNHHVNVSTISKVVVIVVFFFSFLFVRLFICLLVRSMKWGCDFNDSKTNAHCAMPVSTAVVLCRYCFVFVLSFWKIKLNQSFTDERQRQVIRELPVFGVCASVSVCAYFHHCLRKVTLRWVLNKRLVSCEQRIVTTAEFCFENSWLDWKDQRKPIFL